MILHVEIWNAIGLSSKTQEFLSMKSIDVMLIAETRECPSVKINGYDHFQTYGGGANTLRHYPKYQMQKCK